MNVTNIATSARVIHAALEAQQQTTSELLQKTIEKLNPKDETIHIRETGNLLDEYA